MSIVISFFKTLRFEQLMDWRVRTVVMPSIIIYHPEVVERMVALDEGAMVAYLPHAMINCQPLVVAGQAVTLVEMVRRALQLGQTQSSHREVNPARMLRRQVNLVPMVMLV